jgi:hypothetical protein
MTTRRHNKGRALDRLVGEALMGGAELVPPRGLRAQILAAASETPRLARFAPLVARLADVDASTATALLARVDDDNAWETGLLPGIASFWVDGGPKAQGAIRGFVRIDVDAAFPEHEHLGDEAVLVLQGILEDSSGRVFQPGDIALARAGTRHGYRPRPGGTDLLIFSVVKDGIRIGDLAIHHRDAPTS